MLFRLGECRLIGVGCVRRLSNTTYRILGAAMRYVALPETTHIATYVARYAFGVGEARIPAKRAVAKDPADGLAVTICIVGSILLVIVVVVIIIISIVIAVNDIIVVAEFAICEQIFKVRRHLGRCPMTAVVCHNVSKRNCYHTVNLSPKPNELVSVEFILM